MKIKGLVLERKVAQRSKTPRTELRIKHKDDELTLRVEDQKVFTKIDPSLKSLVNREVELEGSRIQGTKVFIVKKFTLLDPEKEE